MHTCSWSTLFLLTLVGIGVCPLVAVAQHDNQSSKPGPIAQAVAVGEPDGTPIEGAVVTAEQGDAAIGTDALTDREGVAYLTLLPGTYRFQVQWRDRMFVSEASYACQVLCERPMLVLPFAVDVVLRNLDEPPVSGAVVTAFSGREAVAGFAWTDAAGIARLVLPPGSYTLQVERDGVVHDVEESLDVPAQRSLEILIPPCDDCE